MNNRILEIDGLRAIAMTMVIAQHCKLLPFGWIGVWLFYLISGYVITLGFLTEETQNQSIKSRYFKFMWRRFFRIVPIYSLYLVINVVIIAFINKQEYLTDLPYLFSFTYNWRMIFGHDPAMPSWGAFGHLWTLSVEEQFYIFFPLIALVAAKQHRIPITILFIAMGPIIRWYYSETIVTNATDNGWVAFAIYASSVCHFDAFLLGSLIARVAPYLKKNPIISNVIWLFAATIFIVYAIYYIRVNIENGATGIDVLKNIISGILYGQHREVFLYFVVDLLLAALLIHTILQRAFTSFLSSKLFVIIGTVSYGGYLFHALILWVIKHSLNIAAIELSVVERLAIFIVVYLITIGLAYLSYTKFESPISKWSRDHLFRPKFLEPKVIKQDY